MSMAFLLENTQTSIFEVIQQLLNLNLTYYHHHYQRVLEGVLHLEQKSYHPEN